VTVCNCKFYLEEVSTTCDSGWVVNRYGPTRYRRWY
jgi:hypothetical protein